MSKIIVSLFVILLSTMLLVYGYHGYPVPGADSIGFIPPAISFANGKGLLNEILHISHNRCSFEFEETRFVYYAPLFPLLLGYILWKPLPQNVFIILALINISCIIISAYIFYKAATIKTKKINWFSVLLVCLSLMGIATKYGGHSDCRPDVLATLFLLLSLCAILNFSPVYISVCLGLLLAFLGATHPSASITFALLIGIFYSIKYLAKQAIVRLIFVYFIAFVIFGAIMFLSPYSVWETLKGISECSKYSVIDIGKHSFLYYYFLSPVISFYGLIFFLAVFVLGHLYFRYKHLITSHKLFLVFLILLAIDIWYFSFRSFNRSYNLFLFSPLFFLTVVYYVTNENKNNYIKLISIVFVLLTTIGFVRSIVLFPYFLKYGVSLNEARGVFNNLSKEKSKFVILGTHLWVLSENYKDMIMYVEKRIKHDRDKCNYIVLFPQNYSSLLSPPKEIGEYKLVNHNFIPYAPKIFGIKLANTMPSYAFAVYKCNKKLINFRN